MTEHEALLPLPLRVHGLPVKLPPPLALKLTVPVGVDFVPTSVSVTVAVHVDGLPAGTGFGLQLTLVLVVRLVTVRFVLPLLVLWSASPPYAAVIVWVPVPNDVGV